MVLGGLDEAQAGLVGPAPAPDQSGAMRAVLTRERFSDPDWSFERELDGIRCLAIRGGGRLRHPRWLGRRDDRAPRSVVREQ
jgi:hypothetical protein